MKTYKKAPIGGLDLNFVNPEVLKDIEKSDNPLQIARHALSILMMGWPPDAEWGNLVSWPVIKAVFLKHDHELFYNARLAFQEGFNYLYKQIKDKKLSSAHQQQIDLYLSNCLSILPFMDINPYESVYVPQRIANQWVMVEYKVVPIELTHTKGFERFFLTDSDRVFAYGLEPISHDEATPHLIFMGTTYPAGQGFMTQIHTNLQGFETAGKKIYSAGRDRIIDWIEKQPNKPHVCGLSLGGTLSLLLAIDQGDKLARVDALNPAGLHHDVLHHHKDHWNSFKNDQKPLVIIQKQRHDPISHFGYWKPDWRVLQVNPPPEKDTQNQFAAHALNYAGFAKTEFIELDAAQDNHSRRWRNKIFYSYVRAIVFYLVAVPYHYVIQPTLRLAIAHPFTTLVFLLTNLGLAFTSPILLTLSGLLIGYKLGLAVIKQFKQQTEIAECHQPSLKRNPSLDLYKNFTRATFKKSDLEAYENILSPHASVRLKNVDKTKETRTIQASKAEIHDIKRSIHLINHWGLHRTKNNVQDAVLKQHQQYLQGLSL